MPTPPLPPGDFDDLDDLQKARLVRHRDLGQHLAVYVQVGQLQPVHERAVGEAGCPGRRVYTGDPQLAELALANLAVAVGVDAGVVDLLFGGLEQSAMCAAVSFGAL